MSKLKSCLRHLGTAIKRAARSVEYSSSTNAVLHLEWCCCWNRLERWHDWKRKHLTAGSRRPYSDTDQSLCVDNMSFHMPVNYKTKPAFNTFSNFWVQQNVVLLFFVVFPMQLFTDLFNVYIYFCWMPSGICLYTAKIFFTLSNPVGFFLFYAIYITTYF